VSEPSGQLWRDNQDFATRDPGAHAIVCLFVDGIAERIRPGQRRGWPPGVSPRPARACCCT
jgi:putative transposase